MSQAVTMGSGTAKPPQGQITNLGTSKLVVENVEVIRRREVITIPEIIRVEERTVKYVPHEEETIKYKTTERPTTNYTVKEEETTCYKTREEETIKYIPVEVKCEKPILIDTPYERPVVKEKEYTIVTFKDMEAIRELLTLAPKLIEELSKLRKYTLVEEMVRVPKIQYEPTKVERVVWEDKHRCKKCGDLVSANPS